MPEEAESPMMTILQDERWWLLVVARSVGESLSPEEQSFVRGYAPQGDAHRAYAALLERCAGLGIREDTPVFRAATEDDATLARVMRAFLAA